MKNILLLAVLAIGFMGCSSEEVYEPSLPVNENIDFTVSFKFLDSGSMSKSGQSVYQSFYDNYINTKVLTPTAYKLTFVNKETQATVSFEGKWGEKNLLKLLEGEYEVTGYARPNEYNKYGMDTISITFNEAVNIAKTTDAITLTAKYDSYMLMFDASTIEKIQYKINKIFPDWHDLTELDGIYYMFIKDLYGLSPNNSIEITRNNGKFSNIDLDAIPFEKGKYYYFNDITESFEIPPMNAGN